MVTTENAPESLVEGCVSAITGELYIVEDDLTVQAAEPIHFSRSFLSSNNEWSFFHHLELDYVRKGGCPPEVHLKEPNGTTYYYTYPNHVWNGLKKRKNATPSFPLPASTVSQAADC